MVNGTDIEALTAAALDGDDEAVEHLVEIGLDADVDMAVRMQAVRAVLDVASGLLADCERMMGFRTLH